MKKKLYIFLGIAIGAVLMITGSVYAGFLGGGNINTPLGFLISSAFPADLKSYVQDQTDRDSISPVYRFQGMFAFSTSSPYTIWQLQGGIANSNWATVTPQSLFDSWAINAQGYLAPTSTALTTLHPTGLISVGSSTIQNLSIGNSTTTNATTTNLSVTGFASSSRQVVSDLARAAGTLVAADPTGRLIATSTTGGVTNVTGSGNIASSGGATPNITFTGILPEINGGTASSSFGVAFYNYFHATSTTALSEGTNLYYTSARSLADFITNLSATTSVNSITTLNNLSLPVGQITGTLPISKGGTNATSFSINSIIGFDGTRQVATGTPQLTVGNINATSTTATSTFSAGISTTQLASSATSSMAGIQLTSGCFRLASGTCLTTGGTGTVTSVDFSVPAGFGIANNPITTSGTLALSRVLSANAIIGTNASGNGDVATGTPQLTIGNLNATSTTATSTFAAGISTTRLSTSATSTIKGIVLTNGSCITYNGTCLTSGSSGITVDSTTITGGIDTQVLFQKAGKVSEDTNFFFDPNTGMMTAYDLQAIGRLNTSNGTLNDSGFQLSHDWYNRTLNNSATTMVLDYQNSYLYGAGTVSMDWGNRLAYDSSPSASIDWGNRLLYDSTVSPRLDWQNGNLYGAWNTDGASTFRLSGTILDNNGSSGSNTYVLTTDGTNATWQPASAGSGTVTSVGITTSVSGLSVTGCPITTSGVCDITGSVDISGGTNLAVASPITLSGDTVGFDFSTTNTWTGAQNSFSTGNVVIGGTTPIGTLFTVNNGGIDGSMAFRSGNAGKYMYLDLGRTANDALIGITGADGQFTSGSLAGDLIMKVQGNAKIMMGNGSGSVSIDVSNNLHVGTTTGSIFSKANFAGSTALGGLITLTDNTAGTDLKHRFISSRGGNEYFGKYTDAMFGSPATTTQMTILSNGNVGIGTTTPAVLLDVFGVIRGTNFDTTSGTQNTIVGENTGGRLGQGNTVIGNPAGTALTVNSANNTIIGDNSCISITDGDDNVCIGEAGTSAMTTGNNNVMIGILAQINGQFDNSVALGRSAIAGGSGVIALGGSTAGLYSMVGVGTSTPRFGIQVASSTGSQYGLTDPTGGTNKKTWALRSQNGEFSISSTTDAFATSSLPALRIINTGQIFAPGTLSSGAGQTGYWCYDANGQLIRDTVVCIAVSALRFKEDIRPLTVGLNELMQLHPVTYKLKDSYNTLFKNDPNYNGTQMGFVADEVQKIDPKLVTVETSETTFEGKTYPKGTVHGLSDFSNWVGLLTKSIQELNTKVENLKTGAVRSVEENWQWAVIALLSLGFIYQQLQIRKLKNDNRI